MGKQRMPFKDAMDLVPDDLPDGAFFAMAHEIAGLEYGDGFGEMDEQEDDIGLPPKPRAKAPVHPKVECPSCHRQLNGLRGYHQHWRDRHEGKPPFVTVPGRTGERKKEKQRQRRSWKRREAETYIAAAPKEPTDGL